MTDYTRADLPERLRALLDFCVQVTRAATSVRQGDVEELRQLGWSDEAIHDAVQVTGLFNYYDRLADALGLEPEDFMVARPEASASTSSTP